MFFEIRQDYFANYNLEIDLFFFTIYLLNLHKLIKKKQDVLYFLRLLIFEIFQYEYFLYFQYEFKMLFFIEDVIVLKLQ